ncbi:hypothetical protein ABFS82_14G289200 [Erythranthe guttata]|uniref:Glycosyltransferase n=1 Tax=Erythranthe guttata TaxID=4155 RepID=A0A022R8H5_ERYGU|nr:PREDICTED: UDP-glycosyltransferase 74E2-like [Erythranthe guttata]EYU36667.1 hypothetical protein MIMGU_mgv1a006023mg [Erythranthe guttata]|eukprot:XP_012839050.1 PREDICTED: UDP-glycosyltransferase 74E2-like [Erythranthe guttata]
MAKVEEETAKQKPRILVVPYPAPGHLNPALAFAKYLASKGLSITVIITTNLSKSAKFSSCSSITIENISDGSEEVKEPESIEGYFKRLKTVLSQNLANFIDEQKSRGSCAKLIMYDSIMPWVLDVAHVRGLLGASFFTQACGVCAIYYHMKQGSLRIPRDEEDSRLLSLPSLPTLETRDLPCFTGIGGASQTVQTLLADQFSNLDQVDWIFFNTFDNLEYEVVDWMAKLWPIKTVGPTFALLQKDEKLSDNKSHMISLFEPNTTTCKEWLDSKETASVVYVSFGSIASLRKEQMEELANGLIMSNRHFLWVVRASEMEKLPPNFTSLTSEKGLIVEWCHQMEVLAHRALACFMTHCGWNSTLEALINGVPLIAMAWQIDQTTNSKFIEDVWGVGVRVKSGENGIVGREEIATCIEEVTQGDKGVEIKTNACKWKELANEAVEKGGTSANNIEDFVSKLMSS